MDSVSLQQILTTVMTGIVDRSTDHAKPHSIWFFYHNFNVKEFFSERELKEDCVTQ